MQTYLQFKTKIKSRLFPSGEPLSLVGPHDASFQAAMLDLQQWVPCLKQLNVSTFESSARKWENAKTFVDAPFGQIRRVYTVAGGTDRWRDKVFYKSSNFDDIECWARRLYNLSTTPANAGLPILPYGVKMEEAATDSQYGRARVGLWAIHRKQLYVAPWLQSTETLVVEWDGEKNLWLDSDGVDETYWRQDAEAAVEYYVAFRHHMYYGDRSMAPDLLRLFENARAKLMYWCRENTRQQTAIGCDNNGGGDALVGYTSDRSEDDDDPTEDTTEEDAVLFDFVADVEMTDEGAALAAAVESDNPEFLVVGGDIGYAASNDGYENGFGSIYGWAKSAGIVIPALGNHEYEGDADLSEYLAYFADEVGNNGRYYEFTHGSIHGFCENRNAEEPDGINNASIQAEWLISKATLSPARWKFAFGHQAPFSSGSTYGSNANLQRNYAAAGIQIVFSGHEHSAEHIIRDGVHYVNCGLGGRSRYEFGSAIEGSQFRYNAKETRVRVTLNCDQCLVEFITSDGEIVHSFTIE